MDLATLLLFILGLGCLIVGGEMLVRGASRLARTFGVSPLVIGLTVVAYGTGSPELAVSAISAYANEPGIALGNVVGSNILNVLLVLGASALIAPLNVARQLVKFDVPIMIGVSALLFLFASDGVLGRLEGFLCFAGLMAYTVFAVRVSRRERLREGENSSGKAAGTTVRPVRGVAAQIGLILGGLALLVLGSHGMVAGAVATAHALGVSELLIGLTIVAVGTSLPEVVTSIIAALRGERDIAVGNVVGSNIFNILGVLGLSALIARGGISVSPAALRFDIPVMIAVAVACLPIFFTGSLIARWEGGLLFFYYLAYLAYLVLRGLQHDALPFYSVAMAAFLVPLTGLTLFYLAWRSWRTRHVRIDPAAIKKGTRTL
jgi:cation:H+ antiporter